MDINMPVMSGTEATEKIRALEQDHQISKGAIIALTAADTEKSRLYGGMGFDEIVSKPISKAAFYEVLGRHTSLILP